MPKAGEKIYAICNFHRTAGYYATRQAAEDRLLQLSLDEGVSRALAANTGMAKPKLANHFIIFEIELDKPDPVLW